MSFEESQSRRCRWCEPPCARSSDGDCSENCVQFVVGGAPWWLLVWEGVALLNTDHCTKTRNITVAENYKYCEQYTFAVSGALSSWLMIFFYMNVPTISVWHRKRVISDHGLLLDGAGGSILASVRCKCLHSPLKLAKKSGIFTY